MQAAALDEPFDSGPLALHLEDDADMDKKAQEVIQEALDEHRLESAAGKLPEDAGKSFGEAFRGGAGSTVVEKQPTHAGRKIDLNSSEARSESELLARDADTAYQEALSALEGTPGTQTSGSMSDVSEEAEQAIKEILETSDPEADDEAEQDTGFVKEQNQVQTYRNKWHDAIDLQIVQLGL